ncbi:hypothetical protein E05_13950 [Plautia stali symbiont]|nr:hypothetical protein E05_13950 [Plautia stali symbiont]
MQAHYQQQSSESPADARFAAGRAFAELLSLHPVDATPQQLTTLRHAGWTPRGIVTLAQLVGFVSFQSRLLTGLRLLSGEASRAQPHAVAGKWHSAPLTASGQIALTAFTQQNWVGSRGWQPNCSASLRRRNRRRWQKTVIASPTISVCWRAICRCWNNAR